MRKRTTSRLMLCIVVLLLARSVGWAALRGGCAGVNITPPLGIPLIGSKGKPSDAVMDDLYAKAMVLSDGRTTIAIVSADLLYAPLEDITNPVRDVITERTGIPQGNIMVCATHTHSGPEVFTRSKVPREGRLPASQIDQSYLQVLIRRMADSASMACGNMQDVRIGAARGRLPEVIYNRRPTNKDGRAEMAFTLPAEVTATRNIEVGPEGQVNVRFAFPAEGPPLDFGPIDPEVFVLRMEDAAGEIVGSLFGFGCHPVCVYPYLSTTISADYPGHATRVIERAEGGISLFTLGLAGNVVPLRRGVGPCKQIGKALGGEALRRLQLVTTSDDIALAVLRREITLPMEKAPSSEEAAAVATPDSVTTEIQILKLGDIYILGLPGEVLVEVGLEIKKRAGVKDLFIVSLANDAVGYVCHGQAYDRGGYEPGSGTDLAKGAGEIVVEQALALIDQITHVPDSDRAVGNKDGP